MQPQTSGLIVNRLALYNPLYNPKDNFSNDPKNKINEYSPNKSHYKYRGTIVYDLRCMWPKMRYMDARFWRANQCNDESYYRDYGNRPENAFDHA